MFEQVGTELVVRDAHAGPDDGADRTLPEGPHHGDSGRHHSPDGTAPPGVDRSTRSVVGDCDRRAVGTERGEKQSRTQGRDTVGLVTVAGRVGHREHRGAVHVVGHHPRCVGSVETGGHDPLVGRDGIGIVTDVAGQVQRGEGWCRSPAVPVCEHDGGRAEFTPDDHRAPRR